MTYEEWAATLIPFEAKALTRKEIFTAGAASRDVEIAELVAALEGCLSSGKAKGPEPHGISLKAIDKAEKALAKVRKP